eukprot:GHVO01065497.1.p1 GENE.GHVO01065497.1~~GHVO01065497.1.p1  ORF type:complete len:168 (+),score=32.44 GHVO01065497.1:2-505(+)
MFSGVHIPGFLSFRTLLAKCIGLCAGLGGGLSVGKEGPFVHISTVLANMWSHVGPFHDMRESQTLKRSMLAVAVAAGVTATFGAPMGGVLFSIEVTATYFMVRSLWKAFVTSAVCVITFKLLHSLQSVELFGSTNLPPYQFSCEMISFAVLGGGVYRGGDGCVLQGW